MNATQSITEREIIWQQVVRSKSGGDAHVVTHYGATATHAAGFTCSNCKGFEFKGKCAHLQIAVIQQAREQAAVQALQGPAAVVDYALLDNGPTDFDAPSAVKTTYPSAAETRDAFIAAIDVKIAEDKARRAAIKAAGKKAMQELFGADAA